MKFDLGSNSQIGLKVSFSQNDIMYILSLNFNNDTLTSILYPKVISDHTGRGGLGFSDKTSRHKMLLYFKKFYVMGATGIDFPGIANVKVEVIVHQKM